MFVNDLHKCTSVLAFNLFVDDTNIFLQDKNLNSLEFKLNEELHKVNQWLQLNRLSFVVFCPPQRKPQSISLKFQTGTNIHMSWVRKFQEVLTSCLKLDILSLMILYTLVLA